MKHIIEVEVSGTIRMEVDDEVVSDWDGKKVLEIYEREDYGTQAEVLAGMAYSIGILGSWDGFADFDHAKHKGISVWDFVDGPTFDTVYLDEQRID